MTCPRQGVDNIVDVDEVAGLAAVAREPRRLTVGGSVEQPGHGAPLGKLTGPVHGGWRQRRELDAVVLAVGRQQLDDRFGNDATNTTRSDLSLLEG